MTTGTRRKYLTSGVAAMGGVLASACGAQGGPDAGGSSSGATSKLSGKFEMWVGSRFDWNDPAPKTIFDSFKAKHPNIQFDLVLDVKDMDGSIEKFTAASVSGLAPDFAHLPGSYMKDYADKKWITELDPYFKASKLLRLDDLYEAYQRDCQWGARLTASFSPATCGCSTTTARCGRAPAWT